ncbi:MAG: hypothetical protein IJ859_03145 [Synergistaceae bacterium]|nr:hypothetical protein [Synergistaceae bacterium]
MTGNDYNDVKSLAMNTAKKIALSFLESYKNGLYANELSTDKTKFFFYNNDFEAGLNNELFWEFKKLNLWQVIENDDWDEVVKLAMQTAYEAFRASETDQ